MICTACKNQLLLGAKFCGQCGTKNQQAQTSAVQSSGMPANALRILSVEAADPDSDGDMSVEVKFSVTNKSGSGWDQLTTRIQIISESGCIEETPSSHEEFIGDGETEEFSVNFYGVKAKLFLEKPEKTKTLIHVLACRTTTTKLAEIEVPAAPFAVVKLKPVQIDDTLQMISGAVWRTAPDSDKDVRVEARWLVQNLTNASIPEVRITADVVGKSGAEIGDAGSSEEIRPGSTALISGSTSDKEKKLVGSKMIMSLRVVAIVSSGSFEHLGLTASDSDDENAKSKAGDGEFSSQELTASLFTYTSAQFKKIKFKTELKKWSDDLESNSSSYPTYAGSPFDEKNLKLETIDDKSEFSDDAIYVVPHYFYSSAEYSYEGKIDSSYSIVLAPILGTIMECRPMDSAQKDDEQIVFEGISTTDGSEYAISFFQGLRHIKTVELSKLTDADLNDVAKKLM